jgi:hypothetical protein
VLPGPAVIIGVVGIESALDPESCVVGVPVGIMDLHIDGTGVFKQVPVLIAQRYRSPLRVSQNPGRITCALLLFLLAHDLKSFLIDISSGADGDDFNQLARPAAIDDAEAFNSIA